ncbi:MAG TPA: hypothetical protein VMR95_03185 [Candidatus Binatia bacterium]|nr:hypothetical protein [Candidatus Binatia bacterium]
MQVPNWSVLGDKNTNRGITQLTIRITNGLFTDLSTATDGLAHLYANSSRPNWAIRLDPVTVGSEFNFADLLGLIPDLWEEHTAWTGQRHERYMLRGFKLSDIGDSKRFTWLIGTQASEEDTRLLFPNETVDVSVLPNKEVQVLTSNNPHFQPVQLHHGPFNIGDTQLVPPIGTQDSLSTIEIYYAVAYVMSMLARYRLSDWLAVWRGEKGDSARPVFERAMDLMQDQPLQICADIMEVDTPVTL